MINLEKALVGAFSVIVKPMDRLQHQHLPILSLPLGSTYSRLLTALTQFSWQLSPYATVDLLAYSESVKSSSTNLGR